MADNTNNIRTGVIDIPGALRPLGGADASTNQVGGVVAYTGDIYDVTAGKNQAALNAEFAEGIANAGSSTGTITGATIGGNPVTESGGILQLPAYPTVPITGIKDSDGNDINPLNGKVTLPAPPSVPITKIKVDGASDDLPINEGRVVIPSIPVKGIQTSNGTDLSPNGGIVTLPAIPADPTTRLNSAEKRIAALESELGGDPTPVVIPVSAVNLPHTAGSTFTYDPDDTYVMNISDIQISTVCYPYDHTVVNTTTSYLIFKAIDRDLYYVYTHNLSTDLCTYFEEKVFDELSHEEAKAVFEAGKYAVKQIIDVNNNGIPRPLGYWKHGIPSVFVTPHGYPLRYNQIKENNVYYVLLKCDEVNKIFKYSASNSKWSLVSGGCYTKNDASTGENYIKYDAYFDRPEASSVSFDDSVTHMNVSNVQQAIQNLAVGISGGFSNVTITLKTNGEQPIANQAVTIAVTYQGETYDLTTQSSYNNGFTTDSNGHIALNLPLGAVYQISFHQYNVNYSTPDTLNGIIDKPICNLTGLYVALSDNEAVLINVDMLNAISSTTPNGKEAYIDFYISGDWVHSYTAVISTVGTPKTIKDAQGNVIKSGDNYVTIDIPKNTQFRVRLQLWDTSLTEEEQIYIASSNISKIASNARSIINMSYTYALPGLFLVIKDSTTEKGYAEYKILNVDSTNNTMEITINGINYTLSKDSNNNIYRKESNSADSPAQWFTQSSSSDILGVGIRATKLINAAMNDEFTYNLGYTNCCFRVSRNLIEFTGQIATTASPNIVTYSNVDGMFQTRKLASFSESQTFPSAQKAINDYKQTLNTSNGSITIDGFIPVTGQMEIFSANYNSLMFILPFINGTTLYFPYKNQINYNIGCSNNVSATTVGSSNSSYRRLKGDFTTGSSVVNTETSNFFVFYPF